MNKLTIKTKSLFKTKPARAFLLFLTGFFLTQVLLTNILYARHPQGGWVTELGNIPSLSILSFSLLALTACLVVLWRSSTTAKKPVTNHELYSATTLTKVSPT